MIQIQVRRLSFLLPFCMTGQLFSFLSVQITGKLNNHFSFVHFFLNCFHLILMIFFSFCHLFLENLMTPSYSSSSSSSSALLPFPPAVCNFIWLTSHWTLSCSCFASFIIGSVSTNLHETVNQVLVVQIIRGKNPN